MELVLRQIQLQEGLCLSSSGFDEEQVSLLHLCELSQNSPASAPVAGASIYSYSGPALQETSGCLQCFAP